MSSFGRTDAVTDKPKWDKERQVRPFATLQTTTTVASGNTLVFGTGSNVANANISVGMSVIAANVGFSGEPEFFVSNTKVSSVTSNTVTLSTNVLGSVPSGTSVHFDYNIAYKANTYANTYNQDTVLVTPTRLANASFGSGMATPHTGWVNVKTGTGGRAGRVQVEVLTVVANAVALSSTSGNTSNSGTYYSGV